MVAACACLPHGNVFGFVYAIPLFVGEAYMPPGRGVPHAGFPVGWPFSPVCRAGVHARRTDKFLNIFNVRRGQDPALQCGANTIQTVNGQRRGVSAGGIYAAPTHGPNAVTTKKRYCGANGHGGRERPPYKARQTPYDPYPGGRRVHYTTSPIFARLCRASTSIFHFYFFIFNFPAPAAPRR